MTTVTACAIVCQALIATRQEVELLRTWKAIVYVESHGDCYAVGDGGLAVGPAQLHPCYVRDTNRILRRQVFTLADRTNMEKCWTMFRVCSLHYAANGGPELWAKTFHRGTKDQRDRYWARVSAVLR